MGFGSAPFGAVPFGDYATLQNSGGGSLTLYMSDVFVGTDNAAWNGSNWTQAVATTAATAYILSNRGRMQAGTNTVYTGSVAERATGAGQRTDIEVDLTFNFSGSDDGSLEIWVRSPSPFGSSDGYYLLIARSLSSWIMFKAVSWTYTQQGSSQSMTFTSGLDYKAKFKVTGVGATVTLSSKVWLASGSEPGSWTTATDSASDRVVTSNYVTLNLKGGNAGGQVCDVDDVSISDGGGSIAGAVTASEGPSFSVIGSVASSGAKTGTVTATITRNVNAVMTKAGTLGVFSTQQIIASAYVAGFGGAPAPIISAVAVAIPSPGVTITCTFVPLTANTITIYRQSSAGKIPLRGATNALIAGTFVVNDFEAPLNENLIYTAVTFDNAGVPSSESIAQIINLSSVYTWLADPITPSSAAPVRIKDFPMRSNPIDFTLLNVVGSDAPIMVAGARQMGAGKLSILTSTLNELNTLRALLATSPVLLLRAPSATWDIGSAYIAVGNVDEKRVGLISDPMRVVDMDVTFVNPPSSVISGSLHSYAELDSKGYTYRSLSSPDLTYLQLAQRGGL